MTEKHIESRDALLKNVKTVLLVDDSIDLSAIFESLLQSYGLKVLVAYDIVEAKNILERNKNDINLILSDMVMPNGTGLDFLKWTRDNNYKQNFIIMSGYLSDIVDTKDVKALHAVFLEKPFSEDSFFEKLGQMFKAYPGN